MKRIDAELYMQERIDAMAARVARLEEVLRTVEHDLDWSWDDEGVAILSWSGRGDPIAISGAALAVRCPACGAIGEMTSGEEGPFD